MSQTVSGISGSEEQGEAVAAAEQTSESENKGPGGEVSDKEKYLLKRM